MSNVALFPVSTEEDLLFELVFPGVDLTARTFRVEVRERSSATVKVTLAIGSGLTLIGTDRIRARVAKAGMAAWTQNIEYTADLVETTGAVNTTLVQVRVQYYQPGRLPGSASLGNAATIQIVDNTATVISYSGPVMNIGAALASNVEVTPAGGITATDAQAALEELDTKKAPKASPALTGVPTAPTAAANTNTTQIATTAMVQAAIAAYLAAQDAMVFKGVIDCSANPNYPAADAGWTYKVSVAGRIGGGSGPHVEVGDTLVCIADGTASGDHGTVGAFWAILQTNIDGAVTGPASATDGHLAQFDGASGKVLKGGISLDTDGTLTANSDTSIATQKAVKTYADNKVGKAGAQTVEGPITINPAGGSPISPPAGTALHVVNQATQGRFVLDVYGGVPQIVTRRVNGSVSSPTAVGSGETVGTINCGGYDGSVIQTGRGTFQFYSEEPWTAGAQGTGWRVQLTPSGGTATAIKLTLSGAGDLSVAGALIAGAWVRPQSYTVATVPSASGAAGGIIDVTDEAGGRTLAMSDGTNWRRVHDRAVIS